MAERRMFAKTIISSDAFLDMPPSSQALYFHLCMGADDEGFVNNANGIRRTSNCSEKDFEQLRSKNFVIAFESGVIAIKHWLIHNTIQNDRCKKTVYKRERDCLRIKENKAYSLVNEASDTECIQDVSTTDSQIRLDKIRLDKNRLDKMNILIQDVISYLNGQIGSKYKASSEANKKHIIARFNDGYKLDDFIIVIDKKKAEWTGTDMEKFLCPDTLFGSKFEKYLNQTIKAAKTKTQESVDNLRAWVGDEQ